MFRSIRVTLLFWYAVVLVGSMAVLGTALHREMRGVLYREADAQLAHQAGVLRGVVERAGGADLEQVVRAALPAAAEFAVFDGAGRRRVASGERAPQVPPENAETVTRSDHRWRVERLATDGWLVVGRSVRAENHGIRGFLIVLLATGAAVVVVALAGGFVLVTRALAPAREIAATARRISAHTLGERIPLDRVPAELRDVARALNDSFERLQAAFAMQTAFTADASHELRTPLAILRSHLELARTAEHTPEELRERLEICEDATQRLAELVASLLTLARADSGQTPLDEQDVDLRALVADEVTAMAPLAGAHEIDLACDASVPVTVRGDRDRLREVVSNLIDNAIRYNRAGGQVRVTLARDGDEAVLRVADTGIGIDQEHREQVFERFFRADPARAHARGGSGLGLAIVKWIVEAHGGSITANGRAGPGAELVVRLTSAR